MTFIATDGSRSGSGSTAPHASLGSDDGDDRRDASDVVAFSLVLATVGRSRELAVLVDSLVRQTCRSFEVIVVDQNEDDRVAPYLVPLERAGIPVLHLRAERRGLSRARNAGLERARGRIVAFPDDDCWYEPDVLERVAQRLDRGSGLDGVAVSWQELERFFGRGGTSMPLSLDEMRRFRGTVVTSISLFVSRDSVERAGRFDARLGVGSWYGAAEETDLVLRLLEGGARMQYLADITVHHAYPPRTLTEFSLSACASQRARERGIGALYAKHGMPAWVVVRGLVAPLARGLRSRDPVRNLVRGWYDVLGRVEGMLRWRLRER